MPNAIKATQQRQNQLGGTAPGASIPTPDKARYVIIQAQPNEYGSGGSFVSTSDQLAFFTSGGTQANFDADANHGARCEFIQASSGVSNYNGQFFVWTGRKTIFRARAGFTFYDNTLNTAKFFCGLSTGVNDVAGGFSLLAFHVEKSSTGPAIQTWHCAYWVNNVLTFDIDTGILVGVKNYPLSPNYHDFEISIDGNVATFFFDGKAVGKIVITPLAMGVFFGGGGFSANASAVGWGLEYAYCQNSTI